MIGQALIKNLKHCKDLIEQGHNVVFVYPYSARDLPKHIMQLIHLNDIFEGMQPAFEEKIFGNIDGYKLINGKYFGFKAEYNDWFKRNRFHLPLNNHLRNNIIYVRFDFDPDLHLANEILDS